MNLYVPALWVASGVCLITGVQFALAGVPRRQNREYLAFGLLSLLLSLYLLTKALIYHLDAIGPLREVVRVQVAIACLIYPAAVWFLSIYTGLRRWHLWLTFACCVFGVLFVVNFFSPNGMLYLNIVPRSPITLSWGETLNDYRGVPSRLSWVYYISVDAVFLWAIWRSVALWREGVRHRAVPLIIYLAVQFLATLQLEYVLNSNSRMLTFASFTFLALVLLMSDALRREQVQRGQALAESIAELHAESHRRQTVEADLRHMAYHDQLTELPNRRLLRERLKEAISAVDSRRRYATLIQLDLDHFKTINDSLGHSLGDQLLRKIAARISEFNSAPNCIARLGGDEFAILITDLPPGSAAARQLANRIAEDLIRRLTAPFHIGDHELVIGVSAGVAVFDGEATVDSVLRQADIAQHAAKQAGRNTAVAFAESMQETANRRLFLEKELRLAIDRNQLELFYQPQTDVAGRTIGAEALLRWRHPQYGHISPAEFIPIAEETGLIHAIGIEVLRQACNTLRNWPAAGGTAGRLSVNISPWQLFAPEFVNVITDTVNYAGADPHRLTLEITENAFLHDLEDAAAKIRTLDDLGIHFALDDFGSGYSSLSSLKKLLLRELKIDQNFVHDMSLDSRDRTIEGIIMLAHHLHLNVVAEGVETETQRRALVTMGCDALQGYLISKPLSKSSFFEWLH